MPLSTYTSNEGSVTGYRNSRHLIDMRGLNLIKQSTRAQISWLNRPALSQGTLQMPSYYGSMVIMYMAHSPASESMCVFIGSVAEIPDFSTVKPSIRFVLLCTV